MRDPAGAGELGAHRGLPATSGCRPPRPRPGWRASATTERSPEAGDAAPPAAVGRCAGQLDAGGGRERTDPRGVLPEVGRPRPGQLRGGGRAGDRRAARGARRRRRAAPTPPGGCARSSRLARRRRRARRRAGSPAHAITAAIEELQPGLVVVGSTHRGGFGRVMPGSTAERVIHGCAAPVAVVPHQHELPRGRRSQPIAAGFEPTDEGRAALRVAADLARATGAKLLATHGAGSQARRGPGARPAGQDDARPEPEREPPHARPARHAGRAHGRDRRARRRGWRPSPTCSTRSRSRGSRRPRTAPTCWSSARAPTGRCTASCSAASSHKLIATAAARSSCCRAALEELSLMGGAGRSASAGSAG